MNVRLLLLLALLFAGCATPAAEGPDDGSVGAVLACPDPCELPIYEGPLRPFEPTVAVDPRDPARVAVATELWNGDERWIHVLVSEDAGATWSNARLPGGARDAHPAGACGTFFDPIVAFLPDGKILAGGVGATRLEHPTGEGAVAYHDVLVYRSADGGRTFPHVAVLTSENGVACQPRDPPGEVGVEPSCAATLNCLPLDVGRAADKPYLAVGPDGVAYASWSPGPSFARSADGGATWTQLPALADPPAAFSADLAPSAAGTLRVAVTEWVGPPRYVAGAYVARLEEKGWVAARVAEDASAYPVLRAGAGASGERLFLVYPRAAGLDERHVPTLSFSDDGGETWSAPVPLDDVEEPGVSLPTLAVDAEGVAYSGFFHHLPGNKSEYRLAAFSDERALPPVTVSRSPIGRQTLGLDLGHYMGLAPLPDGALAVWVSGEAPQTQLRLAVVRLEP